MENRMDKKDVLDTLKWIDEKLNGINIDKKVDVILVGGGCLLLHDIENDVNGKMRYTGDIDCIQNDFADLLIKFYLDVNTAEFYHLYLDGWEDRLYELDGFKNIKVYLLNEWDLFFSKLAGGREKDVNDCIMLARFYSMEVSKLKELFEEWILFYPSNEYLVRSNFEYIIRVLEGE